MTVPEYKIGPVQTGIGSVDHEAPYSSEFCWVEEYLVTPLSDLASWILPQLPLWWLSLYQLWIYRLVYYVSNLLKISTAYLLLLYHYPVYGWISQSVHKFPSCKEFEEMSSQE